MIAISSHCSMEYFSEAAIVAGELLPQNEEPRSPLFLPQAKKTGAEIGGRDGALLRDVQPHDILCGQKWFIAPEDCIEHMSEMPEASVDCAIFSPPFPSLFAYTSEACDIGNSEDLSGEAKIHLGYFFRGLRRVLKPGRVAVCHVMQIPRLARTGGRGLFDFRGLCIRLGQRAGLVFEYDWLIPKNPQSQAIRTHSHNLQFAGLERDRANSRGALGDYLIKFIAPGENRVPVNSPGQVSRNDWIDWAEAAWYGIKETDTLNTKCAKGENDTKHICPLQLGVIRRLVKLYSNPGEIVFSPFAGIGSEGYEAIQHGRRFYGCEIKPEYRDAAEVNLKKAHRLWAGDGRGLFDDMDDDDDMASGGPGGSETDDTGEPILTNGNQEGDQ